MFAYNNEVCCFGGHQGPFANGWKWNPNSPTVFTNLDPLLVNRPGLRAHAMSNGKVYLGGGIQTQQYVISANDWFFAAHEPFQRASAGETVANNKLWLIGGWDSNGSTIDYNAMAQIVPSIASGTSSVPSGASTVTVPVGSSQATVDFDAGTGGDVTVNKVAFNSLPATARDGFQTGANSPIFDIVTSSTGWGTLTITLPYQGASFAQGGNPPTIKHWTSSGWTTVPVLDWQNTPTGFVKFQTTSLSPFSILGPEALTPTPATSEWSLLLLVTASLGFALWYCRRQVKAAA